MLPQQISDLANGFIQHYDLENPALIKFRAIRNSVLGSYAARGFGVWQNGAVIEIGGQLRIYLEKKGRFIWDKLQQILNSTEVEIYNDLSGDLKIYLATHLNPSITAAKNYLEQMRAEANAPSGINVEAAQTFQNLLVGFNAEVDLFCAQYSMKGKNQATGKSPITIGHFAGVLGDVINSQVTVYDYSAIHKMLKERNVPQGERNQIENIMDELKTAPPQKKSSLIEQGEKWIVRNKDFLGAGVEIVTKAIGMNAEK